MESLSNKIETIQLDKIPENIQDSKPSEANLEDKEQAKEANNQPQIEENKIAASPQ